MDKLEVSGVYKILCLVNGKFYIGSSKNVFHRWASHKSPSTWKQRPNSPMYKDMQKYGLDKFRFQILAPVMPEYLKQVEQEFIDLLHPTYNKNRSNGWDTYKEYDRRYRQKHYNQLCLYNGETLTLNALSARFRKAGIEHPDIEAKKYLKNN